MKRRFKTWMCKKEKKNKKQENKREEDKRDEKTQLEIAEAWDSILLAQIVRSCVLVTHSFLRKYILLPSLIIAKNIIRILLFQFPEWSEDFTDWKKEMHVKCTYNGVPLSEREFPKNWLTEGIQIKILFPFRLKPWHRSKIKFSHKNPIKKKGQKTYFCFLTVWGLETELPFGSPQKHLSLFEVFFKELEKKMRKWKKNSFRILRIFKERRIFFFTFSEERKNWFVKNFLFLQEILNKLSKLKTNPIKKIPVGEVYELKLTETQKEKGSINTNWIIKKLSPQIQSRDSKNSSLTEKKMKDLTAKINTTRKQIKKIKKKKKKKSQISKKSYNANSLNLKSLKRILKIRTGQLVRKYRFVIKLWIEKISRDIFLGIINIPKVTSHFFLQSPSQIFDKFIFNNEKNGKRIGKTNPNTIHFISIIKKLVNINKKLFCDVVPLSQAYVFYKLSKTQVIHLYKLRSVLQYDGTSQFVKNEIKEFFETQGLLHSKLKSKNLENFLMNEWKTWLINHYQYKYNLSKIKWSKLIPQKWGNRINQCSTVQNKDLDKWNFSEKTQLSQYEKQKKLGSDPLTNEKDNLKKHFRYNLLSYKSLNYEENSNTEKGHFFDMFSISNSLAEDAILDIEKRPNRKYFDWKILHFCLNKKGDMESWVELGTKQKEHTKSGTNKYKIPQDQKVTPSNEKKKIFDWMGMNDEMLNFFISNFELWFFQKFVILSNAYKRKPWVIPINLLLLNLEVNANGNEKKKINGKTNENLIISRNKKTWIEVEKLDYDEKEPQDQVDFGSVLANEEKVMEENFGESTMKSRKKNQDKSNREAELDFFLKRYLRFQLRWEDSLNQQIITNIKIYCLLLRLTNPREILLSYVQRREINLDILMIQRGLTLTELMKKGILIIEPERLPVKKNGKLIMYHMINILLVHKNKQKMNQRYKEKFPESIERDQSRIGNIEKKDYDLLVPENILSPKRRRELRILISLNSKSKKNNAIHKNIGILNNKNLKHDCHILKPFDRKKGGGN
ncbi:unnamed protein product [Linum tenue]|uniref:Translocon at the inner envelope membrane of chloroplasts 214 n=1 Tax=Linum tenue TaxID=586396 RepID=A0AAV0KU19_9ROSI|nr:unnamed protein product [Linum tenue]